MKNIKHSVWDSIGATVKNSVRNPFRSYVRDSIWYSTWDSIAATVGISIWNSVRYSVTNNIKDKLE